MKIFNQIQKIPKAISKAWKEFSNVMCESSHDSSQAQQSFPNRSNRHHQTNTQIVFTDEIRENELIKKVLYYLSMPVSDAASFHSVESCINHIQKQKQQEGEISIFNFMKNKYSGLVRTASENLTQGNKATSLHILQHIEENLVADRKTLLG